MNVMLWFVWYDKESSIISFMIFHNNLRRIENIYEKQLMGERNIEHNGTNV